MLMLQAVSDSIAHVQLNYVPVKETKKDLRFFFNILKNNDPKK